MKAYTQQNLSRNQYNDNHSNITDNIFTIFNSTPQIEITIEKFRKISKERVQLLKKIEDQIELIQKEYDLQEFHKKIDQFILNEMQKQKLQINQQDQELEEKINNNNIGHYLLKLAFCQTEENRNFFIKVESQVFTSIVRNNLLIDQQQQLMRKYGVVYEQLSDLDWREYEKKIIEGSYRNEFEKQGVNKDSFVKVGFQDVLEMVQKMQVFIAKGVAFVPKMNLMEIVQKMFKDRLREELMIFNEKREKTLENDERIRVFLNQLPTQYTGKDYLGSKEISDKEKINLQDLVQYNEQCFPPCMRNMFDELMKNSHLKHSARLSLGLFLKGAKLSLEDQSKFMKEQFTKKITGDEYKKKNYQYNINHIYGKEGSKTNYTPQNCQLIIKQSANNEGEHHGCPFANQSDLHLNKLLAKMGLVLNSSDHISILTKKTQKQYQAACRILFRTLHNLNDQPDNVGNHPNSYFEESRNIRFTKSNNQTNHKQPMQLEN